MLGTFSQLKTLHWKKRGDKKYTNKDQVYPFIGSDFDGAEITRSVDRHKYFSKQENIFVNRKNDIDADKVEA